MSASSPRQHVVIGFGNVGRHVAQQLVDSGQSVVVLTRSPVAHLNGATHIVGSLRDVPNLWRRIPRPDVIYNCANPPYAQWSQVWPELTRGINVFAQSTGAVLATVSNLYPYGPAISPLTEDLPLRATFPNGRVRAQSWIETRELHRKGMLRAVEVRSADFVCPGTQSRVGDRVVTRVLAGKSVALLGDVTTPHSWAFPSDVARTLISVATDPRGLGRAWHVPANPPKSQREVVDDIADAAGVARVKVSTFPRLVQGIASLVNPTIRELRETDYQFARPFIVDSSNVTATFDLEPTPWDTGLRELIAHYGPSRRRLKSGHG